MKKYDYSSKHKNLLLKSCRPKDFFIIFCESFYIINHRNKYTMNKKQIIHALAQKIKEVSKEDAEKILNTLFQIIGRSLQKGNLVELAGFGAFEGVAIKPRESWTGKFLKKSRRTQEPIQKMILFKPDKQFKKIVEK